MYYKESNIEPVLLTYQVPLKLPTVDGSFTPPIEYIIKGEICCKIWGVFWNGTHLNCFSARRKKWILTDWVMLTQILNIKLKNNLLKSGKIFDNLWPIGCRNTLNVFLSSSYTSSLSSMFISLCCMFKRELWVYRNDYLMPRKHWAFVTLALGLSWAVSGGLRPSFQSEMDFDTSQPQDNWWYQHGYGGLFLILLSLLKIKCFRPFNHKFVKLLAFMFTPSLSFPISSLLLMSTSRFLS